MLGWFKTDKGVRQGCILSPCSFNLDEDCLFAKFLQSRLTLCDPMACGLPGSSVHGILQARILEWVAISFSRGSSRPMSLMSPDWEADSLPPGSPGKPRCVQYIVWDAGLDGSQAGMKISGRNINNLSYADDTTLMANSEEELKSLLIRVKEKSEKAGLKLNIKKKNKKNLGSWHPVPSLHGKQMGKQCKQGHTIYLGSKITVDSDCSHEIKRRLLLGKKAKTLAHWKER